MGARARRSPARRWSTRSSTCPSRCRRSSPASRCSPCTARSPVGIDVAFTRGDRPRSAVRDAALRRPHGAAGADRARPRDGAGRRVARRDRLHIFRRVIFPNLLPAILAGIGLAFARAIGEFGSLVLISATCPSRPRSPRCSSSARSSPTTRGRRRGRGRAARRLLRAAARDRRAGTRARHDVTARLRRFGLRTDRPRLPGAPDRAARVRLLPHLRERLRRRWDAITSPPALHAFWLTLLIVAIAVPLNTIFGMAVRARARAPQLPRQVARQRRRRPAVRPLAGGGRARAVLLYGRDGWFGGGWPSTGSRSSSPSRRWCWRRSSSRSRSWSARSCRCCARSAPSRSRPPARSARRLADLLADHASGHPLGRHLRRHAHHRPLPRRVRRGRGRLRQDLGRDRDRHPRVEERYQCRHAGAYASVLVLALLAVIVILLDERSSDPRRKPQ